VHLVLRSFAALLLGAAIAGFQIVASSAAPTHRKETHKVSSHHVRKTPKPASAPVRATPVVEFPELTCAKFGRPMGVDAPLTASRVRKGDPYYIEFRYRFSYAIISGHMYDVFGRLDANGNPITRQYIGLFPEGGILGLYGGAILPVPAEVHPSVRDCTYKPGAAYRVSLTASQYRALLAKVRAAIAHPPVWQMEASNCNHFAAGLGSVAGLRLPENGLLPSFAYIHAFIRANGDRDTSG
jgi:hypothetical protein